MRGLKNRKHWGKKEDLELNKLLESEGLYCESPSEVLGFKHDYFLAAVMLEKKWETINALSLIQTNEDLARVLFRAAFLPIAIYQITNEITYFENQKLSEFLAPAPVDLEDSHLRSLLERNYFDDQDGRVTLAAYIISRALNREDLVEIYAPSFKTLDFQNNQGVVFHHIQKTFPKKYIKLKKCLENLTRAQRDAVEKFYMNNPEWKSQSSIAKSLGIKVTSLKDRLDAAIRAFQKEFPEYALISRAKQRVWDSYQKPEDRRYDGLYHHSEAQKKYPLYRVNPKTGKKSEIKFGKPADRKPLPDITFKIEWIRKTNYFPDHDGVSSSLYAFMPNMGLPKPGKYARFIVPVEDSAG